MKHLGWIFLFLMLPVTSAVAQTTTDGLEQVGRIAAEVADESVIFLALKDPESGRSYLSARDISGLQSLNVAGQETRDGTNLGPRVISILIGPYSGPVPAEATLEIYGPDGILAANIDTGLKIQLTDIVQSDDGGLSFAFSGNLVPAENADGMMVPVEGGAPVSISGTYSGLFPTVD